MGKIIDITKQKFGKLTVLELAYIKNHQSYWLCQCECGNQKIIRGIDLKNGATKSCGCLRLKNNSIVKNYNPKANRRLKRIYYYMKERCYNPSSQNYKNYGNRGIEICSEWKNDFKAFYEWSMANGYKEGLSIDRINVNGNYEPSNCRWVTMKEQCNNKRTNHFITYKNETHTLTEWSEILNIKASCLWKRIVKRSWSIEKALNSPLETKFHPQYNVSTDGGCSL